MKKLFLITIGLLLAATTWGQAFGITMGMTLDQLSAISTARPEQVAEGYYQVFPKQTSSKFEGVYVQYSQKSGVGTIKLISTTFDTNSYGTQIRDAADQFAEILARSYGKPELFDKLYTGSIWNEPTDWTMGLYKEERAYIYFWENMELPNNLEMIGIIAKALGPSTGYFMVEYKFTNGDKVAEEIQQESSTMF
jgi:hypothetical protein